MTTDTTSAVDKARQLVESKITHIDKLEAAAAELERSKQKFRDDYTAAINAGWSKDELKGIGFEALPTPKKKTKTRSPASSTENGEQSSPASDAQAQTHEAQDHGSDHQQHNHEQHEQFANA